MKECSEITEMFLDYLDDNVESSMKEMFEEHISTCEACKIELETVKSIMALCRETPEEELPENFKPDLHDKLLSAKEEIADKKPARLWHKYMKYGSSLVAGLLLIVVAQGLWSNIFSLPSKSMTENATIAQGANDTENKAVHSPEQSGEESLRSQSADAAFTAADQTQKTVGPVVPSGEGAAGQSIPESLPAAQKNAVENTAPPVPAPASAPAAMLKIEVPPDASSQSTSQTAPKATEKTSRGTQNPQLMFSAASAGCVVNNTSSISLTVETTEKAVEKINSYPFIIGVEGQVPAQTFGILSTEEKQTENSVILNVKVQNASYQEFINHLIMDFGPEHVKAGTVVPQDMTEAINEKMKNIETVDEDIAALEDGLRAPSPDEMEALQSEKEGMLAEISKIEEDAGFIQIELRINTKP